jgi:hypothetical protein
MLYVNTRKLLKVEPMKKMLLALVLMMASVTVSAATISISQPRLDGAASWQISTITTDVRENIREHTFSTNATTTALAGDIEVRWTLTSDVDANFNIFMDADGNRGINSAWQTSVVNSSQETIFSGGLGEFGNINISAGETITATISGNFSNLSRTLFFGDKKWWCKKGCHSGTDSFTAFLQLKDISVVEVSEIPLPAAVWLFGSALLGGLAVRRKRKKALQTSAV